MSAVLNLKSNNVVNSIIEICLIGLFVYIPFFVLVAVNGYCSLIKRFRKGNKKLKTLSESKKKKFIFCFLWLVIAFAAFIRYYEAWCRNYNTSILAISYKYGFTSRGLAGTIYQKIMPLFYSDIYCYSVAMRFYEISTVLVFAIFAIAMVLMLKKVSESNLSTIQYMVIMFTIVFISMFSCSFNFGRIDLFMFACSLLAVILLLVEKVEWLIIPLTAAGVMFHQGYVFMFYNIVLVILLYKAITYEKKRKYYITILVLSLLVCCALFVWFQIIFRGGASQYFDVVLKNANLLDMKHEGHKDLVRAEIRGIDLTAEEVKYRACNVHDLVWFIILLCPYIIWVVKICVGFIKKQEKFWDKIKYLAILMGVFTMLPDFLFKVDYGRWIFAVIAYYMMVLMYFYASDDKYVCDEINGLVASQKGKVFTIFALVYPILFLPFNDVVICELIDRLDIMLMNII